MWMAMSFEGLVWTVVISFSLGIVATVWVQHKISKKEVK